MAWQTCDDSSLAAPARKWDNLPMLRHGDIWAAIDRLAESQGLSASGLARRAGLDATTFNKSKRFSGDRPRWPSTESLAKILDVTNISLGEFVGFMDSAGGPSWRIPVINWTDAEHPGCFDETGQPDGETWDAIQFPSSADQHMFGVRVGTDDMWPIYNRGDILIIAPNADVAPGDRVFVRTRFGEVMVRRLRDRGTSQIALESLDPGAKIREIQAGDILSMQRVILASQERH